jgi:hypothetical protein
VIHAFASLEWADLIAPEARTRTITLIPVPCEFPLRAPPPAAAPGQRFWSGRPFVQVASPDRSLTADCVPRLSCLGPQRPLFQWTRIHGAEHSHAGLCAGDESLAHKIASFPRIAKPQFGRWAIFGSRIAITSRRPGQTGYQFEADPGATGARKPLGGSVSHSRSGSGPSGAALFPIPTQFNGFKLLSTVDVDPQAPVHFTSFPSGSTARTVTGSFGGNGCV